ncbi:MAG TPA: adenylate/guanylate cyclase domain-containing protein, partial [Solirubrobacter sp.]|nr:adenylate/guanylate cyclase domain-containing protein [Solirubrobacter sp.]
MNRRARRLRTFLLLIAASVIAAASLGASAVELLDRAKLTTVNMRFDVRGPQQPPPVVVIAIDDKSLSGPGKTYPMRRTRHAKVIRALAKAGAKVIAYDVQFTEPSGDVKADNALIEATRAAAPRVVMSTTEVDNRTGKTSIFGGDQGLKYSKATPANGNVGNDSDGRVRHMAFQLQHLTTFPIAAAEKFTGHKIALPPGNSAWIDYPGDARTIPYISFADVEDGTFDKAMVRGKLAVVGFTAPSIQDLHSTSTTGDGKMPGAEVQGAAMGTAIAGFPLRDGPGWVDALLVVVLAFAAPLAALRLRIAFAALIGLAAIVALLVAAQLAFDSGTIITIIYALVAGILALLATGVIHGVTVAFEREQARDAFARFVPEAVVDQVLADADGVRLGGVRREGTVMFSDLRGFTSFSETLEPERVIEALNRYLTEMSEAILDHGGTLVAYLGDGIMAVFGAPLQQEDHADRALEASREMLERLEGFNQWLRDQ